MKVLFLEIDTEAAWSVASLGPALLAATLRAHGHEAAFSRIGHTVGVEAVEAAVHEHAPVLIGISMTTRQWLRTRDLMGALRLRCTVPVIVGGLHPTFAPDDVLAHSGIDFACLGEGEQALLELVQALQAGTAEREVRLGRIADIRGRGGLKAGLRPPIEPVDGIAFAARDLLDERWGVVHMSTQRGCPFPCTYCAARMYDQLYAEQAGPQGPSYGRRRSHDNVLAELRQIRAAGPLSYVIFLDDTFTIHHPWVYAFCRVYGSEFGLPFSLHARVETVNPRLLQALAAAGCRHIVYGVESGSERVRREIMQRSASNQRFRDVFRWTREAGIMATANYIMGVPGETVAEMQETLSLHQELQPADFGVFVFYPYPGTALFHLCLERGYLPANYLDLPAVHRRSILKLPGVSAEEIDGMYERWTVQRTADMNMRTPATTANEAAELAGIAARQAECG